MIRRLERQNHPKPTDPLLGQCITCLSILRSVSSLSVINLLKSVIYILMIFSFSMESGDQKDQKKKLYKCNLCEKKFTRKKNRNTHQLSHTAKNFKCDKCDKEFQYPSQLAKHQKVHQGYVCEDCGHNTDTWSKLVKDRGKRGTINKEGSVFSMVGATYRDDDHKEDAPLPNS